VANELEHEHARARRKRAALAIRAAVVKRNRSRQAEMSEDVSTTVEAGLEECSMRTLMRIDSLAKNLEASSAETLLQAVKGLRGLLAVEVAPPIAEVVSKGCLPSFLKALSHPDENVSFEAAWALTNVASGPTEFVLALLKFKAVEAFIDCLRRPSRLVAEQSIWALGNIAGDSYECRDYVLLKGALEPLLDICEERRTPHQMKCNAAWAVSNLFRGKPPPLMALLRDSVERVVKLLGNCDPTIARDAAWSLSYYTDGGDARIAHFVSVPGACVRLTELLVMDQHPACTPIVRIVGNIAAGPDRLVAYLVSCRILNGLAAVLPTAKNSTRREILWALSNVTAGSTSLIRSFFQHPVFHLTLDASHDCDESVAKEALWTLANATNGHVEVTSAPMDAILRALYSKLMDTQSKPILAVCIEGVTNIVQKASVIQNSNAAVQTLQKIDGLDSLAYIADVYHDDPLGEQASLLLHLCRSTATIQ